MTVAPDTNFARSGEVRIAYQVHGEGELDRALDAGATLVGVNARDLTTFELDRDLPERLRPRIPDAVVRVAESGVRDVADVGRLAAVGYDAVLVGEHLVTSADPAAAVAALVGA